MKKQSVFRWGKNIEELKELAKKGWHVSKIARYFNCHHSTVIYQLRKNHIGLKVAPKQRIQDKPLRTQKQRIMAGHCPICSMLLTSEYHKKYPCKENE